MKPQLFQMYRLRALVILLLAGLWLVACGSAQNTAIKGEDTQMLLGGEATGDFDRLLLEAEAHWANRLDAAEVEAAIEDWTQVIATASPQLSEAARRAALYDVYVKLSRAHFMLADDHLPLSVKDPAKVQKQIISHLVTARAHAERAMAVHEPRVAEVAQRGEDILPEVLKLDVTATSAVFWWMQSMGRWMSYQSPLTAMNYVDRLEQTVRHINTLDPSYFYQGPVRFLAGYHTKMPWPGGDEPKAKALFLQAIEADPDCLLNHLAYAEIYAVWQQDRALFERELQALIDTQPESPDPAIVPENEIARRKARRLLERADELF